MRLRSVSNSLCLPSTHYSTISYYMLSAVCVCASGSLREWLRCGGLSIWWREHSRDTSTDRKRRRSAGDSKSTTEVQCRSAPQHSPTVWSGGSPFLQRFHYSRQPRQEVASLQTPLINIHRILNTYVIKTMFWAGFVTFLTAWIIIITWLK